MQHRQRSLQIPILQTGIALCMQTLPNINYDFGSERSKYCTTLLYPHGLIFYTTSELDYRR